MKLKICFLVIFGVVWTNGHNVNQEELKPTIESDNTAEPLSPAEPELRNTQDALRHGVQAIKGTFPYQVSIKVNDQHVCSGALINQTWVLTAAFCVSKDMEVLIRTGFQIWTDDSTSQSLWTNEFVRHNAYSYVSFRNNLALIKLWRPLKLTAWVQEIALTDDGIKYPVGKWARAGGWGGPRGKGINDNLYYVDLMVTSIKKCQEIFGDNVDSSNICAASKNGRNNCAVDIGSPLVDMETGKLIGIASFRSPKGCNNEIPVVFVYISEYYHWIENTLQTSSDIL